MKTKYIWLLVAVVAVIFLSVHTYQGAHVKNAGERVWPTCGGGYVTVAPGTDGGGPCISGPAYTLKDDYTDFDASVAILILLLAFGTAALVDDLKSAPDQPSSTAQKKLRKTSRNG